MNETELDAQTLFSSEWSTMAHINADPNEDSKLDAVGRLAGGIAHDLNNFLAIAVGNLDLLEEGEHPECGAKELVESARNACLRGAELTGQLLSFARKQMLQPGLTDVNRLISNCAKFLHLHGMHIDLRLDLANDLWKACVDAGQLEASITNLVTNACDAMPAGGQITISTRNERLDISYTGNRPGLEAGEYVAIEVSDTGSGMTPEIRAKAVEPFFTTRAEGKGKGLGLSVVFGFVKQSGGHLRILSEVDHGTTVTLLLPRGTVDPAEEASESSVEGVSEGDATVLVVEDNDSLRRVAVAQAASLGFRVLAAANGPAALRVLKEEPAVELMLTDIIMPEGMTGIELGREARQRRPDLKLVYMSGFADSAFAESELEPDIILLRKPFRKWDLAAAIQEALDTKI